MRRLTPALALAFLGLLSSSKDAAAQEARGFATDAIDSSERGSRWFVLDSLDLRGAGRTALGLVSQYGYRNAVAWDGNDVTKSVVRNQVTLHMGASFIFADRVRVGVDIPLQIFADGHNTFRNGLAYRSPSDQTAVGDTRLSVDVRLFGAYGDAFTLAAGARFHVPSGSPAAYTGDGEPRFTPQLVAAGEVLNFAWSAKADVVIRGRDAAYLDGRIGTEAQLGGAVGLQFLDKRLLVGPEVLARTVITHGAAFEGRNTPIDVLLGAHVDASKNIRLGAGLGAGITRAIDSPIRALLSLEWVPGNPEPEVVAVKDKDKDGVADDVDACPLSAGPESTIAEKNGCPLGDLDRDGVPDESDACACVFGVHTADPKTDGCPPDHDSDGVVDPDDACPDEPGVRTLDRATNGCPVKAPPPNPDRDGDGVFNDVDACPDEKGADDPDPKKNGCPKAFLKNNRIEITEQVKFDTGSAKISAGKDSEDVLVAIASVLNAHPEVKKIIVKGYTDNVGQPASNKALSDARAKAVVTWLAAHKIDKSRLEGVGFGEENPRAPNTTDAGKAQNRRVELHVEERR